MGHFILFLFAAGSVASASDPKDVVVCTPCVHGSRSRPGVVDDCLLPCVCTDPGKWRGDDCNSCVHPFLGDDCQFSDALTCNDHGAVDAAGSCACHHGWGGEHCDACAPGFKGAACQFSDSETCFGHGTVDELGTCDCRRGFSTPHCERCIEGFVGDECAFSDEITCHGHGRATPGGACICDEHWGGGGPGDTDRDEFCEKCTVPRVGAKCQFSDALNCNGQQEALAKSSSKDPSVRARREKLALKREQQEQATLKIEEEELQRQAFLVPRPKPNASIIRRRLRVERMRKARVERENVGNGKQAPKNQTRDTATVLQKRLHPDTDLDEETIEEKRSRILEEKEDERKALELEAMRKLEAEFLQSWRICTSSRVFREQTLRHEKVSRLSRRKQQHDQKHQFKQLQVYKSEQPYARGQQQKLQLLASRTLTEVEPGDVSKHPKLKEDGAEPNRSTEQNSRGHKSEATKKRPQSAAPGRRKLGGGPSSRSEPISSGRGVDRRQRRRPSTAHISRRIHSSRSTSILMEGKSAQPKRTARRQRPKSAAGEKRPKGEWKSVTHSMKTRPQSAGRSGPGRRHSVSRLTSELQFRPEFAEFLQESRAKLRMPGVYK